MLDQFKGYLREIGVNEFQGRFLLAVSGGIDSVTMAHLFQMSGFNCAIAHCNFQLRGADSELDEAFVRSLALFLEMPFFVEKFDVQERAGEDGISIQMAARELRYEWFDKLILDHGFDYLATAHNKNDSVETFFLNLSRGTGIRGLTGIPRSKGHVVRPLLFASREDILVFSTQNKIEFREDTSNQETKYRRNKIRHNVIPVMEQLNPGFIETMWENMGRLSEIQDIFHHSVEEKRRELFQKDHGQIRVDIENLRTLSPLRTWLFELFSPFGFSRSQCEGIEKIMDASPGRRSISTSHQLFKDRDQLILVELAHSSFDRYYLDNPEKHSILPFPMDMEVIARNELVEIPNGPYIACLDCDELQFPLTIRHWQHGDYFFPLGMNQIKKLSDFFVDNKISVPEKQQIWIMAFGKKIVWIMGHRIDHRFRITDKTTKVLLLRLQTDVAP